MSHDILQIGGGTGRCAEGGGRHPPSARTCADGAHVCRWQSKPLSLLVAWDPAINLTGIN